MGLGLGRRRGPTVGLLLGLLVAVGGGPGAGMAVAAGGTGSATTPVPVSPGTTSPLTSSLPQAPSVVPTSTAATPVPTTTTSAGSGGLSSTDGVFIGVGAAIVLFGIAFFIWRDARSHAPASVGTTAAIGGRSRSGSKAPPKARKLSAAERKRRRRGRAR